MQLPLSLDLLKIIHLTLILDLFCVTSLQFTFAKLFTSNSGFLNCSCTTFIDVGTMLHWATLANIFWATKQNHFINVMIRMYKCFWHIGGRTIAGCIQLNVFLAHPVIHCYISLSVLFCHCKIWNSTSFENVLTLLETVFVLWVKWSPKSVETILQLIFYNPLFFCLCTNFLHHCV